MAEEKKFRKKEIQEKKNGDRVKYKKSKQEKLNKLEKQVAVMAAHAECPENTTDVAMFLLLGFQSLPTVKPILFLLFLAIYMFTIAGNILILITISADIRLHSPMYFFLGNLSSLEICYTTSIIPTLLGSHVGEGIRILCHGCIMQFSLFSWFTGTECFLLTVMAYDRYVAICHPLRYATLMDQRLCLQLAVSTWAVGLVISLINVTFLCRLQFPKDNTVDHFFCDLAPIIKDACSDTSHIEMEVFLFSFVVLSTPFLLVIVSYIYIILTILRIPSTNGKLRAFSTCSSHLTIVITYFGILILMYMVPSASQVLNFSKAFSLLYTVGTPLFNPIVYTLRNKEMIEALRNVLNQMDSTLSPVLFNIYLQPILLLIYSLGFRCYSYADETQIIVLLDLAQLDTASHLWN
ncbi:olfactory receptor 1f45-like [Ambystoma mexicanum]|uniref:olfactory receptor 1f45-like n=1 Tax=Ambystoma mexicanum TaxID=8296 RepID=UPI0037E72F84